MNKNIIKLAEQAMESIPDDCPSIEHGLAIFNKKFAELIVRECSNIAEQYDAPKMSGPGMIIAGRIESHFGVAE